MPRVASPTILPMGAAEYATLPPSSAMGLEVNRLAQIGRNGNCNRDTDKNV